MQLAKGKRQIGPSSRSDLSKYLDTDYCSYLMMPFFNRNWAGAWKGRWAGPELLVGWDAGSLDCLG